MHVYNYDNFMYVLIYVVNIIRLWNELIIMPTFRKKEEFTKINNLT